MNVIWTDRFSKKVASVFSFWNNNNQSNVYSRKIYQLILKNESILIEFPFLGKATDNKKFRFIVIDRFKIFYQVKAHTIYFMAFFDSIEKTPTNFKSK